MQQTQSQRSFVVFYIVGFVLIAVAGGAVWKFWKGRETLEAAQAKEKAEQLAAGPSLAGKRCMVWSATTSARALLEARGADLSHLPSAAATPRAAR